MVSNVSLLRGFMRYASLKFVLIWFAWRLPTWMNSRRLRLGVVIPDLR
jgi:hypothetical protein